MFKIATTKPYIAQPATTPFRLGWDSNHCVPWMLHYLLRPTRLIHLLLQLKLTKPPGSLSGSSTSANTFKIFYKSLMPSTSNVMINTRCHISFRLETKCGCMCKKNSLKGPFWKLLPLYYGPYTITKAVGDNNFEFNISPFLGLHPVFNLDLIQPYFPPLLDTSEIAEQLTPMELNLECMQ
jgi:hypothetical protein